MPPRFLNMPHRLRVGLLTALSVLGWVSFVLVASSALAAARHTPIAYLYWQLDWHVYRAGASGLLEQDLYRVPLALNWYPLPVSVYNQTPLTAAWALPFVALDAVTGGNIWLIAMLVSIGAGAILAASAISPRHPLLIAGIGLLAYTVNPFFVDDVWLGNINGLMFLLVAAFVCLHLRGHQRGAGLILAIAIATKPWALAFLPLLAREGRWREMRWAGVPLLVQGIGFLGWLGVDVLPHMVGAITSNVRIEQGVPVFGWALVRQFFHLSIWTGIAVGAALLAIPSRGRIGLGIAILAGLTLFVVNLWQHYLPVMVLGACLLVGPLVETMRKAFVESPLAPIEPPFGESFPRRR